MIIGAAELVGLSQERETVMRIGRAIVIIGLVSGLAQAVGDFGTLVPASGATTAAPGDSAGYTAPIRNPQVVSGTLVAVAVDGACGVAGYHGSASSYLGVKTSDTSAARLELKTSCTESGTWREAWLHIDDQLVSIQQVVGTQDRLHVTIDFGAHEITVRNRDRGWTAREQFSSRFRSTVLTATDRVWSQTPTRIFRSHTFSHMQVDGTPLAGLDPVRHTMLDDLGRVRATASDIRNGGRFAVRYKDR